MKNIPKITTIIRRLGKIPTMLDTTDPKRVVIMRGDMFYGVRLGKKVVRDGMFTCAAEALATLKPTGKERLFIDVGGQ